MQEIWKPIEGYDGQYEASNTGYIKSIERDVLRKDGQKYHRKERILKTWVDRGGYLQVSLYDKKRKKKTCKVHRLIGSTFLRTVEGKDEINHIDEDKTNNAVWNLEWCTRKENNNHGTRNERVGKAHSKPVAQYTKDGELVKTWASTMEVERELGFSNSGVSRVARGKRKTMYGYIWKYV